LGSQIGGWGAGALGVETGPFDAGIILAGRYVGGLIGSAVEDWAISEAKALTADAQCSVKRRPSSALRREWEETNGQDWPKDPNNPNRNQDVSHKQPLADGGTDTVDNIEPKLHSEHMQEHIDNGDFARWGARRSQGGL
jgi:hypothetical protein